MMREIDTAAIGELSEEAVEAARARRARERAADGGAGGGSGGSSGSGRLDLDDVELPDNHPWAVRRPVSAEEEALIQARLSVPRRGGGGGGVPAEAAGGRRMG
jgi:hypothetical protein